MSFLFLNVGQPSIRMRSLPFSILLDQDGLFAGPVQTVTSILGLKSPPYWLSKVIIIIIHKNKRGGK